VLVQLLAYYRTSGAGFGRSFEKMICCWVVQKLKDAFEKQFVLLDGLNRLPSEEEI